jgi:hypothetical protein
MVENCHPIRRGITPKIAYFTHKAQDKFYTTFSKTGGNAMKTEETPMFGTTIGNTNNDTNHLEQTTEQHPEWWNTMLTRRAATKSLAGLAAMAGMSSFVTACDDDDEESDRDVLEIQQKEGWNVGSTDKTLQFANKQDSDSLRDQNWRTFTKPDALMKAWQPSADEWKPYYIPTLIQSLSQATLQSAIVPVCSPAMREAYSRGLGMRELIKTSKNPMETIVIADLPGPEAVAFAAAMSDVAVPVLTFDNWPHPLGVVQSHLTLAALIYFAKEVAEKSAKREKKAPAVMVLDGNRLANYVDADNQFDNRYIAKLPSAENLAAMSIKSAMYATPSEAQKTELDDINDDFATYKEKNIAIEMLPVTRFQSAPSVASAGVSSSTGTASVSTATALVQQGKPLNQAQNLQNQPQNGQMQNAQGQPQQYANASGSYVSYAPVYFYGGSPFHSAWFFYHYPVYSYYRPMPVMSRLPATTYSRPAYNAVRRPTVFSASRVGSAGASGIGKQRPTGFGRVAVRTNSSTGRVSGVRAGRSGSFSGSRSGSFGRSSFGGRSS